MSLEFCSVYIDIHSVFRGADPLGCKTSIYSCTQTGSLQIVKVINLQIKTVSCILTSPDSDTGSLGDDEIFHCQLLFAKLA